MRALHKFKLNFFKPFIPKSLCFTTPIIAIQMCSPYTYKAGKVVRYTQTSEGDDA